MTYRVQKGLVYLVGAGPGDPGLLSIKAKSILEQADVVIYDNLVNPKVLEWLKPEARSIFVGKSSGQHSIPQEEINALLVKEAKNDISIVRLKGGDPNLRDGFSSAMARLPQIFAWALVAATVGLILKAIESRSERVGSIVASVVGMAWSITTYFVVPVLVVERLGPIAAVKRSASIIRKTWGESLTAHAGIGIVTFLAILPGIAIIAGGVALLSVAWQLAVPVIILGVLWIWATGLISSAVGSILLGGMYIYAVDGKVPDQFDADAFQTAFTQKKRRSFLG